MVNFRAVTQPSPPPTPPSCSECTSTTQGAAGSPPTQSASKMFRSSNGSVRVDTPQTSVIADLAGKRTILLDHVKKEAMVIPTPPAPAGSPSGGAPKPGGAGQLQPPQVHDLGKSMIEGHEVEGKKFVFSPPPKPPAPAAPQAAGAPQMPKIPGMPQPPKPPGAQAPQMPKAPEPPKAPQPPKPTVTEIWTSTKLKTPVLTKVTSPTGEHTTYCKPVSTEEPHPSLFQIPAGYKIKS